MTRGQKLRLRLKTTIMDNNARITIAIPGILGWDLNLSLNLVLLSDWAQALLAWNSLRNAKRLRTPMPFLIFLYKQRRRYTF